MIRLMLFLCAFVYADFTEARSKNECNHFDLVPIFYEPGQPLPLMNGKLNDIDVRILVDSGATSTHIMHEAITKFKLPYAPLEKENSGIAGKSKLSITRLKKLEFGNRTIVNEYFYVLNNLGFHPYFDLILGADLLSSQTFELNLSNRTIKFYQNPNCIPSKDILKGEKFLKISIDRTNLDDPRFKFDAQIGEVALKVIIDTGASRTSISNSGARQIKLSPSDYSTQSSYKIKGVGGSTSARLAKIKEMRVGNNIFENINILILEPRQIDSTKRHDIILGLDFLINYSLLYDAKMGELYLKEYAK